MDQTLRYQFRLGQGQEPCPVLVLMHGMGVDESDLLSLADLLPPQFLVISLRAPHALGSGFQWYRSGTGLAPDPETFDLSLQAIDEFLGEIGNLFEQADRARLYLAGFSQGGVMAATVARMRGGRGLKGALVFSAYLPEEQETKPFNGFPIFWGHGTHDMVVPSVLGEQAQDQLQREGAVVTFRTYPIGHGISGEEMQEVAQWLNTRS